VVGVPGSCRWSGVLGNPGGVITEGIDRSEASSPSY
jgi:hypothetical protein